MQTHICFLQDKNNVVMALYTSHADIQLDH